MEGEIYLREYVHSSVSSFLSLQPDSTVLRELSLFACQQLVGNIFAQVLGEVLIARR